MQSLSDAFFQTEPPGAVELRAFTHGLMPKTVPAMMQHFVADWRRYGVDAWNEIPNHWLPDSEERVGWWTLPAYLGDRFIAPLVGAPTGTCMLQPNVHWTVQCLLSSPEPFADRKEVVLTTAEFPSVAHSARRWCDLLGLSLRVVPSRPDGFVDREALLAAIHSDTALVFISHVGFLTGERLPDHFIRQLAAKVGETGGLLAIDGYHAAGSTPVDVVHLGADVYFGGLLKEACGSSGNAFVYVRPGLTLTPRITGWFGDAEPFSFNQTPQPHPHVRQRFLGGTSPIAPLYHAVEGVRLLLEAGIALVRAHSLSMTGYCIARAKSARLQIRSPQDPEQRSALFILEVPAADRLSAFLKQHAIYTDSRQKCFLRLAPFVWNSELELERAFDLLTDAVATRRYLSVEDASPSQPGPVT